MFCCFLFVNFREFEISPLSNGCGYVSLVASWLAFVQTPLLTAHPAVGMFNLLTSWLCSRPNLIPFYCCEMLFLDNLAGTITNSGFHDHCTALWRSSISFACHAAVVTMTPQAEPSDLRMTSIPPVSIHESASAFHICLISTLSQHELGQHHLLQHVLPFYSLFISISGARIPSKSPVPAMRVGIS